MPVSKLSASQLTQDGKLLYEMGRLDEAKVKLSAALAADSNNVAAKYYLGLIQSNQPTFYVGNDARKQIVQKLSAIRLEKMTFDAVPLGDVLRWLSGEARLRDPERKGINFIITPGASDGTNEVAMLLITIHPALTNLTLGDALDAVLLLAPKPIKYSIQDFAVVFSARQTTTELFSRTFKVDANSYS